MKVLMVCAPQYGHFLPLLPLGNALIAAGHDVTVATGPALVDFVGEQGLPAVSVGTEVDLDSDVTYGSSLGSWSAQDHTSWAAQSPRNFVELAAAMVDDVTSLALDLSVDIVVHEPFALAGSRVGAMLDLPVVMHSWGLDLPTGLTESMSAMLDDRLGGDAESRAPSLIVDPCPPSIQRVVDDRPRLVVRCEPHGGVHERQPAPDRPRVLLTVGSVAPKLGGIEVISRLADATAGSGLDVIVAVTDADAHLVGDLPDHVSVHVSEPLGSLLPTCAAAVHHGGAGTTLSCLAHGVPQVIVPLLADNEVVAARLVERGVATTVSRSADPDLFLRAIERVVRDHRYCDAAEQVRCEIADLPPVSDIIGVLEGLGDHARRYRNSSFCRENGIFDRLDRDPQLTTGRTKP